MLFYIEQKVLLRVKSEVNFEKPNPWVQLECLGGEKFIWMYNLISISYLNQHNHFDRDPSSTGSDLFNPGFTTKFQFLKLIHYNQTKYKALVSKIKKISSFLTFHFTNDKGVRTCSESFMKIQQTQEMLKSRNTKNDKSKIMQRRATILGRKARPLSREEEKERNWRELNGRDDRNQIQKFHILGLKEKWMGVNTLAPQPKCCNGFRTCIHRCPV